jgi:hypothetical protein
MKIVIFILIMIITCQIVFTQVIASTPRSRIGTADLIISGEVKKIIKPEIKEKFDISSDIYAVVIPGDLIKGDWNLFYDTFEIHNLVWMNIDHPKKLIEGKKYLFFLQKFRKNYVLSNGPQSILSIDEIDKYKTELEKMPISIKFITPISKFYFDRIDSVHIEVTNNTNDEIGIVASYIRGYYFSPKLPANLSKDLPQNNGFNNVVPEHILKPREKYVVDKNVTFNVPEAWKNMAPDMYLQTFISLQACVLVDFSLPHKDIFNTYQVYSEPVITTAGFLPPDDVIDVIK